MASEPQVVVAVDKAEYWAADVGRETRASVLPRDGAWDATVCADSPGRPSLSVQESFPTRGEAVARARALALYLDRCWREIPPIKAEGDAP